MPIFHPKSFLDLRLLAFSGLVLVSALAQAQVTRTPDNTYLLRVKYVKGTKLQYSTVTSLDSGIGKSATPLSFKTPVIMKVKEIRNSKALISLTVGPVTMGANAIQKAETHDVMIDTRNASDSPDQMGMVTGQLPEKAVRVGETWFTTAPIPDPTGTAHTMQVIYKFQGVKTVAGKSMGVIGYTLSGGAKGSGTLLVLASDGTIYSNMTKLAFNTPATGKIALTMEMRRL